MARGRSSWLREAPTPRSGSQPALAVFFGLAHVTPALWIPLTPKFQSLAAAQAFSWSCARQRHARGVGVGLPGSCQLLYFYFLFIYFFLLKFVPVGSCSFLPCCCQPGQEEAAGALPWVPSKARAGMGRVPREPGEGVGAGNRPQPWLRPPPLPSVPSLSPSVRHASEGQRDVCWLPTCPAPLPSQPRAEWPQCEAEQLLGVPCTPPPVPRWQLQPLRCPQGLLLETWERLLGVESCLRYIEPAPQTPQNPAGVRAPPLRVLLSQRPTAPWFAAIPVPFPVDKDKGVLRAGPFGLSSSSATFFAPFGAKKCAVGRT